MLKREIEKLAIYQIDEETEVLPVECLQNLYLNKTSEVVYITKDDKLYGIVSLGDILNRNTEMGVRINRTYISLNSYNVIKAHEIFQTKMNIHKIPIVNAQGELIGDYSRWDDMLYVERNQEQIMKKEAVQNVLKSYEGVYVVEPIENRNSYYLQLLENLEQSGIKYTILNKGQISKRKLEGNIYIFLDEDEKKGVQCLYRILTDKYGNIIKYNNENIRGGVFATYKNLLFQIICETGLKNLSISKPKNLPYDGVDEKTTILLRALEERGVKCFSLYYDEGKSTEYCKRFLNEVNERLRDFPIGVDEPWPKKDENEVFFKEFYGELYQLDDYKREIAQKEIFYSSRAIEYKRDIIGKYFNSKEGKRITCFQPKGYVGTIYLLGPCTALGAFVEDQYTIASCLQKKLLKQGYCYRVENYGTILREDAAMDLKLQKIGEFSQNDIVITISNRYRGEPVGVVRKPVREIFERNQIPAEWVTDMFLHCNHKVNILIADSMLEMIESCLKTSVNEEPDMHIHFQDVMEGYVMSKYLNPLFSHYPDYRYSSIGAIVMNCNPFSKGHRYLIEKARKQVEFLIVFAVEEDSSLFPFEERFKMIVEGIKDLDNVIVVPSGSFVLSSNNFPEYFSKTKDEIIALNAEYDIEVFADYIAKPLHITHRFAGEEPEDEVTRIYNETMKKLLPEKGIVFIEIPRISTENEIVSASRVRRYLKDEKYDKAFSLLPETTKRYLMKQI